jgi:glycosyltransferase involved in cell wall biosynthesis
MRLAVYTDYVYRREGGRLYAERAFALFLDALGEDEQVESLRLIGRLGDDAPVRYALSEGVELAALPHYRSLAQPLAALRSLIASLRHMRRALDDVDVVWVLGPYPHAIALVLVALARRRTVVLGVRQDWPRYVRVRRPTRRWMHHAADAMEGIWRVLARRLPVVAVGSELAAAYAHAPATLELTVSLVRAPLPAQPPARDYAGELRLLSVGRIEQEKNPLLLADVLALLPARWRMLIAGEGELASALGARLEELGVSGRAELLGYVPMSERLLDLYRTSHALLHVSLTEGFPQVLVEAFASGLPVVASDVGGVAQGVDGAALLVEPDDARAAADALARIAGEQRLRERLASSGLERSRALTLEAQRERLLAFLAEAERRPAAKKRSAP